MSGSKNWPELVGQTFEQASKTILSFDNSLNPYNAKHGIQDKMFDSQRVVCVTDDNDIVTEAPQYTHRS